MIFFSHLLSCFLNHKLSPVELLSNKSIEICRPHKRSEINLHEIASLESEFWQRALILIIPIDQLQQPAIDLDVHEWVWTENEIIIKTDLMASPQRSVVLRFNSSHLLTLRAHTH